MKIMQVLLSPRIGGAESLASSLEEVWQTRDVRCSITYLDQGEPSVFKRLNRIRHLVNEYHREKPDIVLSHSAIPNSYCRTFLPSRAKVISVLHNSSDDYASRSLRYAEKFFGRRRNTPLVAVSGVAKSTYEKWFGSQNDVTVIPNGVSDPGLSARLENRAVRRVVTLARITPAKNPLLWKDVAEYVTQANPGVQFDWIGPLGKDIKLPLDKIVTGSSDGRINFVGPKKDGHTYLNQYDLYFHPSNKEALGLSIIEAILVGLPVVCSSPVAEVIGNDLIAGTFIAGNATSAVEALESVFEKFSEHLAQIDERRLIALNRFGIEVCADAYLDLFHKVKNNVGRM